MTAMFGPGGLLLLVAILGNGLLAGLSLSKSLVELPAGRSIGSVAFAKFSRAADFGPGLYLYGGLGTVVPALTLLALTWIGRAGPVSSAFSPMATLAVAASLGHLGATARAAPIMLRIVREGGDERTLDALYGRFRRWHAVRALLQLLAFASTLVVLGIGT